MTIDFEKIGLAEIYELRDKVSDLEQENLRLSGLLRSVEMTRPALTQPERVNPFPGQSVGVVDFEGDSGGPGGRHQLYDTLEDAAEDLSGANVVVSMTVEDVDIHKIVLDIDHPVKVLPSTTEGHHHLFIDKAMTWSQYVDVLRALAVAGVIEPGYKNASVDRGFTAVRLPWVKKEATDECCGAHPVESEKDAA